MAKVMTMSSTRKVKKCAVNMYTALCYNYNSNVKIVDTVKEMLEEGIWVKGISQEFPKCIETLKQLSEYALVVHMELQKHYDFVREEIKEINEIRENGGIIINPVDYMRFIGMQDLGVYLKELNKEAVSILHEITDLLDQIEKIEKN